MISPATAVSVTTQRRQTCRVTFRAFCLAVTFLALVGLSFDSTLIVNSSEDSGRMASSVSPDGPRASVGTPLESVAHSQSDVKVPTAIEDVINDLGVMEACGWYKCFFPSLSDNRTGWLLNRGARRYHEVESPVATYPFAKQAWDLAMEYETKYGMRHYFLKDHPPLLLRGLSKNDTARLTSKFDIRVCNNNRKGNGSNCHLDPRSKSGFVAQRVVKAPSNAVLAKIGYKGVIQNTTLKTMTFRLTPSLEDMLGAVTNHTSFFENALSDLERTLNLIQEHRELQVDLQFMISPEGYIYHIDLDRLPELAYAKIAWRDRYYYNAVRCMHELLEQVRALEDRLVCFRIHRRRVCRVSNNDLDW